MPNSSALPNNITVENFDDHLFDGVLSMLSERGFMTNSNNPAQSIFSSIHQYQRETQNYGLCRGFVLVNKSTNTIVGFYGRLAMKMLFKGEQLIAVQSFSAYILPGYPGHLKNLLINFYKLDDADLYLSIFPVGYIYNSYTKVGYTEVCNGTFTKQHYLIANLADFLLESALKRFSNLNSTKPLAISTDEMMGYKEISKGYTCEFCLSVPESLKLIEDYYNKRNYDSLVSLWTHEILKVKYGNKVYQGGVPLKENEVILICCTYQGQMCGIAVLKKLGGFNRLLLAELQTSEANKGETIAALSKAIKFLMKKIGANSVLDIKIDHVYQENLHKQFYRLSIKSERKIFAYSKDKSLYKSLKLLFADDDMCY